jgi:nucleotide-binding universal stress UspA family protein
MDHADQAHADLIAVGSTNKGRYGCFFFGSVGRAISIGSKHSILIAKGSVACSGKVNAVIATDHSKYADDAIGHLIRMKPQGLGNVRIVTALNHAMLKGASGLDKDALKTYMETKSAEIADSLREAGIPALYEVVEGDVSPVLDRQMRLSNAELLIMGAQGHGFMDRMFIGSSSLHQVVGTPHSILILRP